MRVKILSILVFISILQVSAKGYTQITLNKKGVSLSEVFLEIRKQSGYDFFYNEDLVNKSKLIDIKVDNAPVDQVLDKCLANQDLTYIIKNKIVTIKEKSTAIKVSITIQGIVVNANGKGLEGVTIYEKGNKEGVVSGLNGVYRINVKNEKSVLIFSFIGFSSREMLVGNRTKIDVTLTESVQALQSVDIISTGYQNIAKSSLTGAAERVDKSFFDKAYKPTLQEGLQGSVAGLQILTNNSHPLAVPQVIIRGVGSAFQEGVNTVTLGAPTTVLGNPTVLTPGSPLYIIDGVPTTNGLDLSSINGNDIKSITILKDAGATGIYGARGANGVIVVETKSGLKDSRDVTYSAQIGVSNFTDLNARLNTAELQELYIEGLINNPTNGINTSSAALAFLAKPGGTITPFNANANTDWAGALTRQGIMTQHNLSLSGGKGPNRYYLSLGYLKNETPINSIDFDRATMKLRYDTEISAKFNFSTNLSYGNTKANNYESGSTSYNPITSMYRLRPDIQPYNADGTYNTGFNFGTNPIGILRDEVRDLQTSDIRAAFDANYKLIPGLALNATFGANYRLAENYNRFPNTIGKGLNNGSSFAIQQNVNTFIWSAKALLKYDLVFGKSSLKTFIGVENNAVDGKITNVSVNNLRYGSETLDNGSTVNTYTKRQETALSSIFANLNYAYNDKYLLNASYRLDGSSKFGPNKRYGNFYAVGLGWNMHNEDFMSGATSINMLKLRASYGVNGNDQIGSFTYVGTFDGTRFYNGQSVVTIATAGNSSLSWEKNASLDFGVDYSIFKSRISGSLDFYVRNTSNLLYNLGVSSFNANTFIFRNFGGMRNSGVEIAVTTKNIIPKNNGFGWITDFNLSTYKNKITQLATDGIISGNYLRKIGEDFNTLNLYGYAGVDPATGSELFYTDANENATTSVISQAKKYDHGKTTPDFYGSLTNTFSYKNFSFTAQLYANWGGQIFETTGFLLNDNGNLQLSDISNTSKAVYDRRWKQAGDLTDIPKYVYGQTSSERLSSRWLHDASYIRIKKLELAYNFSNEMLKGMFTRNLRMYVSADNFFTFVKDKTLDTDPEIGGITGAAGFDTPLAKTVYFGLSVSF